MADDILSQFLVRIAYQQDEKSRKDFDQGLKQVQTHAAEFGAKIGALPTIVSEATKRISSSLSEMYYAAQKNGATARELDALRYAAQRRRSGSGLRQFEFQQWVDSGTSASWLGWPDTGHSAQGTVGPEAERRFSVNRC